MATQGGLYITPTGDTPQVQPGQTVYVSLTPFVIPWWVYALGAGVTAYALLGKTRVKTIRQYRRRKAVKEK